MAEKKDLQFLQNKLEHFNQENAVLKYRLSEMVDNDAENNFLQMAEYFQNELLLNDDMLKKLVKEFQEFSDLIYESPKGPLLTEKINENRHSLSKAISNFEKRFEVLSNEIKTKMFHTI